MKHILIDIEVYPNKFMIGLINTKGEHIVLDDLDMIRRDFKSLYYDQSNIWISFNGWKYDLPIIEYILENRHVTNSDIYQLSKRMIAGEEHISWAKNHIDLYCLVPRIARCSLKEFGHRLGYPILANLPYPYDKALSDQEWQHIKEYNLHDLNITKLLWDKLKGEYQARLALSEAYGFHTLWSGAAGLSKKVFKLNKVKIEHAIIEAKRLSQMLRESDLYKNTYQILFNTETPILDKLQQIVNTGKNQIVKGVEFDLSVGGFHNKPKAGVYESIYEYDFQSLYPSMCIENNIGGDSFNSILKDLLLTRLQYKREGDKVKSDAYKLLINSITGCFRDEYAKDSVYSINSSISMLMAGQFNMLDLICRLPDNEVILSNTDSIWVKNKLTPEFIEDIKTRTGLILEEDYYDKVIISDVNSVLCVKDGEIVKRKKEFLLPNMTHNVNAPIITKMVENYLLHGLALEDTIRNDSTVLNFLFFKKTVRSKGVMLLNNEELEDSKVRFYVSLEGDILERKTDKQRAKYVADSPITLCMDLDTTDWSNINYPWYIERAKRIISKILHHGVDTKNISIPKPI